MVSGSKKIKVLKKFIEVPKLIEYGVYNSETDINTNPKTGENKPDDLNAVVDRLTERLKEITHSLAEMRLFIKDNSSLSHVSLDKCITELGSYLKSLEDEINNGVSDVVN